MKARWLTLIVVGVASIGIGAVAMERIWQASMLEQDLSLHVPTASVKDSKLYRVFERRLAVLPTEFELAGKRHRITDVWLEHRTAPRRVSMFSTQQEILPELVLCIDLGRQDMDADAYFKDGKHSHTLYQGVNGVRMTEVGTTLPKIFTFRTWDGRFEAQFELREVPNKAPEPTSTAVTSPAAQEPRQP